MSHWFISLTLHFAKGTYCRERTLFFVSYRTCLLSSNNWHEIWDRRRRLVDESFRSADLFAAICRTWITSIGVWFIFMMAIKSVEFSKRSLSWISFVHHIRNCTHSFINDKRVQREKYRNTLWDLTFTAVTDASSIFSEIFHTFVSCYILQ